MAESIFDMGVQLSRYTREMLAKRTLPPCSCASVPQDHGGTFDRNCPTHGRQAAVLNPTEKRYQTIIPPE